MPFRWHLGAQFLADFDSGRWHGSRDVLPTLTGEPPDCMGVPGDDSALDMLAGAAEGGPLPCLWIGWATAERLASAGPHSTSRGEVAIAIVKSRRGGWARG